MKSIIALLFVLLSLSCVTESQEKNKLVAVVKTEDPITIDEALLVNEPKPIDDPYRIKMDIKKTKNDTYNLIIDMELDHSISYISPNSKKNHKGVFSVSIKNNDIIEFNGPLVESPLSVEEYDTQPAISGYINRVKENTSYKQDLEMRSGDDFKITGMVRFMIEPRYSIERIGFTITRHSGEVTIKYNKIKDGC